ncbi:MAG: bifunctional hydroxymethylpyrimidine kinase/phosphomethylpyrimidine kinase [Bacilli bacterium]
MRMTDRRGVVRALTVAGSDSGGGAGVQADLKTFAAFRVYGAACVTSLTAQNTVGVQGVSEVAPDFVTLQLKSVLEDIGAHAVKTGMLGTAGVVRAVTAALQEFGVRNIVVDPVMVAKGGESLLDRDAVSLLKSHLFTIATVVTPNLPEAEMLCGYPLRTWNDRLRAARDIARMGPRVVVIKGGHAPAPEGDAAVHRLSEGARGAVDLVFDGESFTRFHAPRIESRKTHGTGCTFSAAITACLAAGMDILNAVASTKAYVADAISAAVDWNIGAGHGPTDHSAAVELAGGVQSGGLYRRLNGEWVLQEG